MHPVILIFICSAFSACCSFLVQQCFTLKSLPFLTFMICQKPIEYLRYVQVLRSLESAFLTKALFNEDILCTELTLCSLGSKGHNGVTHGASDSSAGKGSRQVKGLSLILKQFHGLLVKRFHHAIRSKKDFLAQVPGHWDEWVDGSGCRHEVATVEFFGVWRDCFLNTRSHKKTQYINPLCEYTYCTFIYDRLVFWGLSDRPSCQFCPHSSDLHHARPSVWRISEPDSDPLDVRTTVHLLQVRPISAVLQETSFRHTISYWSYKDWCSWQIGGANCLWFPQFSGFTLILFCTFVHPSLVMSNHLTPRWNASQSVYWADQAWGHAAWQENH